jgi:hypothetical protein
MDPARSHSSSAYQVADLALALPPNATATPSSSSSDLHTKTLDGKPFPFLKLSPELRNEIYSLVLGGGNAIHMRKRIHWVEESQWLGEVCIEPASRHEPFWDLTGAAHRQYDDDATSDVNGTTSTWGPAWTPCFDKGKKCSDSQAIKKRLSLQLLLVCRQIHHEASLVPSRENLFDFADILTPSWPTLTCAFGASLQCCAIENLAVRCLCLADLRRLPARFPGLKRLFCEFVPHRECGCVRDEIFDWTDLPEAMEDARDVARWEVTRADVEETCRVVRGGGVECVVVQVTLNTWAWEYVFRRARDVSTVERQRWMLAELENAFVAKKSVGGVEGMEG